MVFRNRILYDTNRGHAKDSYTRFRSADSACRSTINTSVYTRLPELWIGTHYLQGILVRTLQDRHARI